MALPVGIRPVTLADAAQIQQIYAPFVRDTAVSFEDAVPSVDEMATRIDRTIATHPFYVAECEGEVLGYAYAGEHRSRAAYRYSVDVTAYVHPTAQRRGVGRRLYGALFEALSGAGFHRAYAGVALPNDASIGLHKAVGFELVGIYRDVGSKFGRWHDVAWWQRPV